MLDLWQGTHQMNLAALHHVYYNGIPYSYKQGGITYSFTPLSSGSETINAICMIAVKH